ncbi:sulfatase-like hydrolase/transferase [Bacteroides xylanisolvens]|nr:sulfatase-like hydrolase/transferase [Bacteroides xylanisolvens]
MSKRKNLTTAAAFLCIAATAQIKQKPNILWIMAEDMGQDLECYGMKAVRTPNLNKMASEGVLYRSACCTAPISSPSRSAMMTGVHQTIINAHNHRSNRNLPLG